MKLLFYLLLLALLIGASSLEQWTLYIDPLSLAFVLIPVFISPLFWLSFPVFIRRLRIIFFGGSEDEERAACVALSKTLGSLSLMFGLLGTLLGLVMVANSGSDSDLHQMSQGIGVALLTFVYGIVFNCCFIVCQQNLEKK